MPMRVPFPRKRVGHFAHSSRIWANSSLRGLHPIEDFFYWFMGRQQILRFAAEGGGRSPRGLTQGGHRGRIDSGGRI
jgi:hypothetical protein